MLRQGGEKAQHHQSGYELQGRLEHKCKYGRDNNRDKNGNGETMISQQSFHHEASL
jgi:hypothetical protein